MTPPRWQVEVRLIGESGRIGSPFLVGPHEIIEFIAESDDLLQWVDVVGAAGEVRRRGESALLPLRTRLVPGMKVAVQPPPEGWGTVVVVLQHCRHVYGPDEPIPCTCSHGLDVHVPRHRAEACNIAGSDTVKPVHVEHKEQ